MFPPTIKLQLCALLFVSVISFARGQDRKISPKLNPGCIGCLPNNTLLYIRAEGTEDIIHQIWDFTQGIPTIIYLVGGLNSTLNITWNGTEPDKFFISEHIYSFAIALDKIYEYDDKADRGYIDPGSSQVPYSLKHMAWTLNDSILTEKEAMVRVHGQYKYLEDNRHTDGPNGYGKRSGIVDVKLDLLPFKDSSLELPHLIHTANSTLVDVSLVNLTTSPDFNSSRFALHFVLVSTDLWSDTMHYNIRKSLDDEHTPGVFEIMEIKTPRAWGGGDGGGGGEGGYVQFRPVAYTAPRREVSSSTNVRASHFNRTVIPHRSTLRQFYNHFDEDNLLVQDMFISIGLSGDGFYTKHNFTAWSFTMGYGAPPIESFSVFVIIIISIGLGVPVVLAFSGILYAVIRRYKQRNTPQRFIDDE